MKYLMLLLILVCALHSFAQKNDATPLSVDLKIDKQYEVRLPAKYFLHGPENSDYNITTDSISQQQYDATITLRNNTSRPVYVWLMSCSWEWNFEINNDYIKFYNKGCYSNYPTEEKIEPGSIMHFNAILRKSIKFKYPCNACLFGQQVEDTKVGLTIVDDLFNPTQIGLPGYDLAMADKSRWKIIWSNPVRLLTKEEAHTKNVDLTKHGYDR